MARLIKGYFDFRLGIGGYLFFLHCLFVTIFAIYCSSQLLIVCYFAIELIVVLENMLLIKVSILLNI